MNGFLLDENVPSRVTFKAHFPVVHVRDMGSSPTDTQIWQHAQANGYAIVTKDTDFSNRIMLTTSPPWVIHLRIGNVRRRDFHTFLARVWPQIEALLPAHKLINVYADRIEAVR